MLVNLTVMQTTWELLQVGFPSSSIAEPALLPPTRLVFEQAAADSTTVTVGTQPQQPSQLTSLWDWFMQQQGWQLQKPDAAQLGSYVYAALLKSNASLQHDTCYFSSSLCHPLLTISSPIRVHSPLQHSTEAMTGTSAKSTSAQQDIVYARILLDSHTGERKPPPETARHHVAAHGDH